MRLLFAVHQFFPIHYTGTERLALETSKQMQRMGHSVTVLTYAPVEAKGFETNGDWLIKKYEYQGVPVIAVRHRRPPDEVRFTVFDPAIEPLFSKFMTDVDFDIVHIFHPMSVGAVAKVADHKGVPVILTLTDFWLTCPRGIAITQKGEICLHSEKAVRCVRECFGPAWEGRLNRRLEETRALLKIASCCVSATNSLKQVFESSNLASNIKLLPYGENYDGVKPNPREYSHKSKVILGFLSSLLPHKGAHILLEAYNIAKKSNISLRIYGDHFGQIDYYNTLKKIAEGNKEVEFCGKYEYEDMTRIYNEIDMVVVPSIWWENSPLVLSRALAHNVPAIVSNLGGMTELVKDGENGFSFEVSNPDSLAQVLRKIGDDPTVLNELKKRIRRPPRIEEYAFEYDKIYRALHRRS